MRNFIIIIGLLVAASAVAQEAYRWVDEDGIVQYSDRPEAGASEITIQVVRPSSQPTPLAASKQATAAATEEQATEPFRYTRLEVATPAAEETLWNIEGLLTVSLSLEPALRSEDQLRVYLDGAVQNVSGTQFQLQNVYRGSHVLQAEVVDAQGQPTIRSQGRTFYVQQNTITR